MMWDSDKSRRAVQAMHANLKPLPSPRVLVIDDDETDVFVLRREIEQVYPHVHLDWKGTAEEALAFVRAFHFDLIMLDLRFTQGMSGVRIFESLRQFSTVPVVGLTGLQSGADLVKQAMDAGLEVIFRKPMSQQSIALLFGTP